MYIVGKGVDSAIRFQGCFEQGDCHCPLTAAPYGTCVHTTGIGDIHTHVPEYCVLYINIIMRKLRSAHNWLKGHR